jgi:DNA-binding LytR/AlgR family response regulator
VIMPLPLIAIRILMQIQVQLKQGRNYQKVQSNADDNSTKQFDLINETGKLIISLPENKIICFESNDNYVITYYLDNNYNLKKSMDRASLKQIETVIIQSGFTFLRVHKSHLINPLFVERILGRTQAHKLKLHFIDEPVSVSRNFDVSQIKPQPIISKM